MVKANGLDDWTIPPSHCECALRPWRVVDFEILADVTFILIGHTYVGK